MVSHKTEITFKIKKEDVKEVKQNARKRMWFISGSEFQGCFGKLKESGGSTFTIELLIKKSKRNFIYLITVFY